MNRRFIRRLAVLGMAVGLLVGFVPAEGFARSPDAYDQLQQQISQTRAKIRAARKQEQALMAQLAQSDQRRMSLEHSLAMVTDQLLLATRHLDALQLQADQASADLQAKTAELERAIGDLNAFTNRLHERAANIYMRGPDAYSAVLFGANDFHSYVAGMVYAESVLNTDVNVVDEITSLRDAIEQQRSLVEQRRLTLQQQAVQVSAQQTQLATIRTSQSNARVAVLTEINNKAGLLARVRSQRRAYGEALQAMLEQSRNIESLLQRAQRGQKVTQGKGGYLKWPVSGVITSPFGWRIHPIFHVRSFHTGIDIAAPYGTTVKAARAGEVLYVGVRPAYGLVVIIDHGGAIATVYAHLSKAYVRAGQWVPTLGSVGAIGCSGWCTGPHLHFEVRVSGVPVNPIKWL